MKCMCGCGEDVKRKFKVGHWLRTQPIQPMNQETKNKISQTKLAEKNPNWKAGNYKNAISKYTAIHSFVSLRLPKPEKCNSCKERKAIDLAFKDHSAGWKNVIHTKNLEDWEWLCRRCHMLKDGRLNKFLKMRKSPTKKQPNKVIIKKLKIKVEKNKENYPWNKGKKGVYSEETLNKMRKYKGERKNNICLCGCGKEIPWKRHHTYYKVRYISGHHVDRDEETGRIR